MIYLALIAIWPLINYSTANFGKISSYGDIFILFLVLISASLLASFAFKKIFKLPADRLILPVFLGTALFFAYSDMYNGITYKILEPLNISLRASYIYLFIFISVSYFAWKISSKKDFQKASKVLVCVVFALSSASFVKKVVINSNKTSPESNISKMNISPFQFRHKPNVYYILVDAYARQDTLKEVADYDNELFLKKLEKAGFIVSRSATSNYHFTLASLPATMNMAYHEENENKLIPTKPMKISGKGINAVRKVFSQNDYLIINAPAHWHEFSCHGNEDVCIMERELEVYHSFLSSTPLRRFRYNSGYVNLKTVGSINSIAPDKPKFIFAHLAQIHDGVFDESGQFSSPLYHAFISDKHNSIRYTSSINVINVKLLEFVDYIRAKDPNSIIIIQADHGPRYIGSLKKPNDPIYWSINFNKIRLQNHRDFRYTFGIFTAIYLPNYNENSYKKAYKYFSGSFSLVNTFRYIFAYLSDQNPVLLPEKSYHLSHINSESAFEKNDIDHLTN